MLLLPINRGLFAGYVPLIVSPFYLWIPFGKSWRPCMPVGRGLLLVLSKRRYSGCKKILALVRKKCRRRWVRRFVVDVILCKEMCFSSLKKLCFYLQIGVRRPMKSNGTWIWGGPILNC